MNNKIKEPIETVKERFNNVTSTKEGVDGQKWEKIKTDGDMGFWKVVWRNSFES